MDRDGFWRLLLMPALCATLCASCDDRQTLNRGRSSGNGAQQPLDAGTDAEPWTDTGPSIDGSRVEDGGGDDVSIPLDAGGVEDAQAEEDVGTSGEELSPLCSNLPARPPQPPVLPEGDCSPATATPRIRDIRDPRCLADDSPWRNLPERAPGVQVVLEEVVVNGIFGAHFAVQDPGAPAYGGLWVYNRSHLALDEIRVGSRLRLRGELLSFFSLTELIPDSEDGIELLYQGDPPPPVSGVAPEQIADGGELVEPLESMLVQVPMVKVVNTVPDCPRDFGMFEVSGGLRVDDKADLAYIAARNDVLTSLTGVLHFSFEHNKLLPRHDQDLVVEPCFGLPDKCEASECVVEADELESGRLIITEIQNNPRGDDSQREYLELYNPGPEALQLDGWWIQDCAGHRAPLSGELSAREHMVLVQSLDPQENGGVPGDLTMDELFLPNGYGSILVFSADERLVDQVRYEPIDPWPSRAPGEALELLETASDNRMGAAWAAASERYGEGGQGSPGEAPSR